MPTSLSQFIRQQLLAQQLSERDYALRSGVGLSHIYQILRGERKHVRSDTLDKLAIGLNMTPAEMAVAMGRSAATDVDPDEAEALALFRQVPPDMKDAAKGMLRGLAAETVQPTLRQSNGRRDGASTGRRKAEAAKAASHSNQGQTDTQGGVSTVYRGARHHLANFLSLFDRPVPAYSGLLLADAR